MVRSHLSTSASTVCLHLSVPPCPMSPRSITRDELSLLPSVASLCTHILDTFPSHLKNFAPAFTPSLSSYFNLFFFFNVLDHFCLHPNTSSILKAEKPSLNPTSQAASPFLFSSLCSVPQESFLCSPTLFLLLILILF